MFVHYGTIEKSTIVKSKTKQNLPNEYIREQNYFLQKKKSNFHGKKLFIHLHYLKKKK